MQAPVWLWTAQQMVIHVQTSAGQEYPITVLSSFLWPILDYSMKEPTDAPLITVLEMLLETCPLLFTVSTLLDAVYPSWSIYFSRNNPMGSLGNRMGGELFSLISPSCLGSRYGRAVFRVRERRSNFSKWCFVITGSSESVWAVRENVGGEQNVIWSLSF